MQNIVFRILVTGIFLVNTNAVLAHAEHDKVRYVASSGVDDERCESATKPCKTISYAVQHANKGDKIYLSKGSYPVDDDDTLFYLLSDLVPIIGNYQTGDKFKQRSANNIN